MKRAIKLFCLILATMLTACSDKAVVNTETTIIPVDIDRDNSAPMSAAFDSVDVIALEGDRGAYLKAPWKMTVKNGNYYFMDQHVVSVFNHKGNFISNSRHRLGRSGQEYLHSSNYIVYDNGDIGILLLDGIIVYDNKFNFVRRIEFPESEQTYFTELVALNDYEYILCTYRNGILQYGLYSENENDFLNYKKYDTGTFTMINPRLPSFQKSHGKYYYNTPFINNSLSLFDTKELTYTDKYTYDLGKYTFDTSIFDRFETEPEKFEQYNEKHAGHAFATDIAINDNYLIGRITYSPNRDSFSSDKDKLSVVRLSDGGQFVFNNPFEGGWKIPYINFIDNEALYVLINTYTDIDTYADPALMSPAARERLASVNDDTNAVIFKYYLRKNIGE